MDRLRHAVATGDVVPFFQPVVEIATGRTRKLEALARWTDPDVGPVPTLEFVRLAEETGIIRDLDLSILRQACAAVASARTEHPDLGVAINCSPLTLAQPRTATAILAIIEAAGLPCSAVWIEAIESTKLAEDALHTMRELAGAGVHIVLDDFGTGYANLANLCELPVSELKIDRSFVCAAPTDRTAQSVVRAIVGLGRDLGIDVVAEGVESDEHESTLQRAGVNLVQGYRYGAPMPIERVLERERRTVTAVDISPAVAAALATPSDPRFDTLLRIAAEVCGTPITMADLLDAWQRQRYGDQARTRILDGLANQVIALAESDARERALSSELTAQRAAEEALRHRATHDGLTGLPNRELFFSVLQRRVALPGTVVLYIDLDGFKTVNDQHGHATGDQLLLRVAECLQRHLRADDLVARLGGDEFAIVTCGAMERGVGQLAGRVRAAIRQPQLIDGNIILPDASIGGAVAEPGDDVESLLARADAEMYRTKRERREQQEQRQRAGSRSTDA